MALGRTVGALVELEVVVICITIAAALLPGVVGLGVKLHREIVGAPEQERLTELSNDTPTGSTLKL
jgi:hypothetical protein